MIRNIILVNPPHAARLRPLCWTRPVAELRIGITTLTEKWKNRIGVVCSHWVEESYLQEVYPTNIAPVNHLIAGHLIANDALVYAIGQLKPSQSLFANDQWLASCVQSDVYDGKSFDLKGCERIAFSESFHQINYLYDLFQKNDIALREDYKILTANRISTPLSATNSLLGNQIFVEEGAVLEHTILNSLTGPIYIGKGAEVMEGAMIRGPFFLGEQAQIKMGAKIYGATTIGPDCRVGGEINNSIMLAHSNKAHDGFLGNAIIGEWCNLGADTNNSNLKNNYEEVKLWNYQINKFEKTSSIFCGLMMGDHAKCGINTMFNTGTVVGVGANVFGDGYPRQFIPDFAWGGAAGFASFHITKFLETANIVMGRRNIKMDEATRRMLEEVYLMTKEYRVWEK